MFTKVLTLAGGIACAALSSQYPEFTQQYMQRLGGQVDALAVVIRDFDTSARSADMTRDAALASMGGSVFLDNRRKDMRRTIARHEDLSNDLEQLSNASPLARISMPHRLRDTALISATYKEFRPAIPLTLEGFISAVGGFFVGWGLVLALIHFLSWPLRRRRLARF
ncbi:DUF2937 family protein [Pacificibacter maritimus]|uniref:DUF2937 family protein n=1 Tax=Pacificibacter maritimus TaxID=762213 RepID=A0A3N4UN44_9RHOB|nr:DUF2937 family protein [Pacificibacter maritimus]RPE72032.1 DUF2937 family protein [Pacificibacter maritimus]